MSLYIVDDPWDYHAGVLAGPDIKEVDGKFAVRVGGLDYRVGGFTKDDAEIIKKVFDELEHWASHP